MIRGEETAAITVYRIGGGRVAQSTIGTHQEVARALLIGDFPTGLVGKLNHLGMVSLGGTDPGIGQLPIR